MLLPSSTDSWFTRSAVVLRSTPTRVGILQIVRGVVGLGVPLLIGAWSGRMPESVIAGVGALWAVTQDGRGPVQERSVRITLVLAVSALGLVAGQAAFRTGSDSVVISAIALAALASGAISTSGPLGSAAGLHLLLGTIVGGGMLLPGEVWWCGVLLLTGGMLVLCMTGLPLLWASTAVQRAALRELAHSETRVLEALAAFGQADEKDLQRMRAAQVHADDLFVRRAGPAAHHSRVRLQRAAAALHEAAELVAAAAHRKVPIDHVDATVPASILAAQHSDGAAITAPDLEGRAPLVRRLHALVAEEAVLEHQGEWARPPRTSWAERARFGIVLSATVVVAAVIAFSAGQARAYWMPLVVAFIFKPDAGALLGRVVNRVIGTALAAACGFFIAPLLAEPVAAVAWVAAMGGVVAWGVARHYAVGTFALTCIVFVFVEFLGDDRALFDTRLIDTFLAGGLVLVASAVFLRRANWRARAALAVQRAGDAVQSFSTLVDADDELARRAGGLARRSILSAHIALGRAESEWPFRSEASERADLRESEHDFAEASASLAHRRLERADGA